MSVIINREETQQRVQYLSENRVGETERDKHIKVLATGFCFLSMNNDDNSNTYIQNTLDAEKEGINISEVWRMAFPNTAATDVIAEAAFWELANRGAADMYVRAQDFLKTGTDEYLVEKWGKEFKRAPDMMVLAVERLEKIDQYDVAARARIHAKLAQTPALEGEEENDVRASIIKRLRDMREQQRLDRIARRARLEAGGDMPPLRNGPTRKGGGGSPGGGPSA